jgi:hypothetical protein
MNPEIVITPDMTPEEIAAVQNPGGDDGSSYTLPAPTASAQAPAPAASPAEPASNAQASMEGRLAAATREAEEARTRASLLEQNNQFLQQRQSETAAEAAALREKADKAEADRKALESKMARATAPTVDQATVDRLVEEHGEHGAKPFISMENRMLAMRHEHSLDLASLKEATTSMPKQIETALGVQQANAASSAFNAALMDPTSGVPNLGTLLKDPTFVSKMQADPWGAMNPFNAALASNDKGSIPTIRAIVERITGVKAPAAADPGTNGGRSSPAAPGSGGDGSDRDALITQWNGMLDRGEIVAAQAFSSKHKLMD